MEPVYIGQFVHTLDAQNRLAIPKEWRNEEYAQPTYFLLPADDRMIRVVSQDTFTEKILSPIRSNANVVDDLNMKALTKLGGLTGKAQMDRQGRIVVPQPLLEHAGILDGKALLVGSFTLFHICAPQDWSNATAPEERDEVKRVVGGTAGMGGGKG